MMTKNRNTLLQSQRRATSSTPSDVAAARRAALAIIASEGVHAFAQARHAAQRELVHALENATTSEDVNRCLARFTVEASRDYAGPALSFHDFACTLGEPAHAPLRS